MKSALTIQGLKQAAKQFSQLESKFKNKKLFGTTDGKAIGTFFEQKF